MPSMTQLSLFGGNLPWSQSDWTSSDDTVRGGTSYSNLVCSPTDPVAIFKGSLDTKTLGGAGFASQRTTGENRVWNISDYEGILLVVKQADGKRYTFILRDQSPSPSPDGREQSTVGWEYNFTPVTDGELVKVFWSEFKPTYRGRESPDTAPLDLKHVKGFSLMMRSFFGTQEGEFSLSIASISAFSRSKSEDDETDDDYYGKKSILDEKGTTTTRSTPYEWVKGLFCFNA